MFPIAGPPVPSGGSGGTDFTSLPYEIVNLNTQGYTNISTGGRGFSSITYDGNGVGSYVINDGSYGGGIIYTQAAYARDASGNKVVLTDADRFRLFFRLSAVVHSDNPSYTYMPAIRLDAGISGKRLGLLKNVNTGTNGFTMSGYHGFVTLGGSSGRSAVADLNFTAGNLTTAAAVSFDSSDAIVGRTARNNLWTTTGNPLTFKIAVFQVSSSANAGDVIKFKAEIRAIKFS